MLESVPINSYVHVAESLST